MWSLLCAAYMLAAAGVCGSIAATGGAALPSIRHDLEREERKSTGLREELSRTAARIGATNKRLETCRLVHQHPDWSGLFRLIARERGEEVVLEGCDLRPVAPSGKATDAKADRPTIAAEYSLALTGLTRSQKSVSGYVLALEKTGLFESVQLVETRSRTEAQQQLVGFTVRCALADKAAPKPEKKAVLPAPSSAKEDQR